MREYRSDCWDEGNFMTRWIEVHETCPHCGGESMVYDMEQKKWVECPVCEGTGEIMYEI